MSTFSRQEVVCGHCGLKINRHSIKSHTEKIHPGMKVYERPEKMKSLTTMLLPAPNNQN